MNTILYSFQKEYYFAEKLWKLQINVKLLFPKGQYVWLSHHHYEVNLIIVFYWWLGLQEMIKQSSMIYWSHLPRLGRKCLQLSQTFLALAEFFVVNLIIIISVFIMKNKVWGYLHINQSLIFKYFINETFLLWQCSCWQNSCQRVFVKNIDIQHFLPDYKM